ncbi:hypothetical protein [Altererythrobacter sp. Root672]|uniref:hypothetical protein n=1 Tax=Altererythrobacter sp. Root672 TaxID=1736584 RepID=UPI0006F341A6|nr:hypothetical protein [Altererythrobacter sp. Root672]KRA80341.1 hypothetical protein ASD76_14255 [Altererythrobacter sp. Root672]
MVGIPLCVVLVLASFPLSIAFSRQSVRKGNAAGVSLMVGMAFMTVYDPKMAEALEVIQTRREIGDVEEDAAGGVPLA